MRSVPAIEYGNSWIIGTGQQPLPAIGIDKLHKHTMLYVYTVMIAGERQGGKDDAEGWPSIAGPG